MYGGIMTVRLTATRSDERSAEQCKVKYFAAQHKKTCTKMSKNRANAWLLKKNT